MSMNLRCDEVELPHIGTVDSYKIYGQNEGGTQGVKERLRNYLLEQRERADVGSEADWFLEHLGQAKP